jgi:hypothetical protein
MAAGFRLALKSISDRFSSKDVEDLKYLCEDHIPLGDLEKLKTGTQLFSELQRRGKISETNLSMLEYLLEGIDKKHLLKLCTDAGYGGAQVPQMPRTSGSEKAVLPGTASPSATLDFEFRKILTAIAGELTPHNFNELLYLSVDYFGGVKPKVKKPLELFILMEQQRILLPGNLSALQSLLSSIGRKDLADKLVTFANTPWDSGHQPNASNQQPLGYQPDPHTHHPPGHQPNPSSHQPPGYPFYPGSQQPSAPFPPVNSYPQTPNSPNPSSSDSYQYTAQPGPQGNVRHGGVPDAVKFGVCPASDEPSRSLSSNSSGSTSADAPFYRPPPPSNLHGQPQSRQPRENLDSPQGMDTTVEPIQAESNTMGEPVFGHGHNELSTSALQRTETSPVVLALERSSDSNVDQATRLALKEYREKEVEEELKREQKARLEKERELQAHLEKDREHHQQREKQLHLQIRQLEKDRENLARQLKQAASTVQPKTKPVDKALCYPMKRRPHGVCLIINNFEFYSTTEEEKLPYRRGSDVDEHNLTYVFTRLNYAITTMKNATGAEIIRQIKDISNLDHSLYDSFVCCLLTHGKMDGVFGADGNLISVAELASILKGASCPTLNGKPKMFFVQACRGDDEDKGATLESDDGPDSNRLGRSLPNAADFLFAYSTAPGTVSWRSIQYGSWYISKLCEVLDQHAKNGMDLVSMLTVVNDKVSQAYTKQGFKQCPAPVNMLRKQVIFV